MAALTFRRAGFLIDWSIRMRTILLLAVAMALAVAPLSSQNTKAFQVGLSYNSFSDPIWRHPDGSGEIPTGQTSKAVGGRAGIILSGERAGLSADVWVFSASFEDLTFSNSTLSGGNDPEWANLPGLRDDPVTYSSAKYALGMVDLGIHWFPAADRPFSVVGLFGMGMRKQSFDVTGAKFPEWNGEKSFSEFSYSYGLGLRWSPVRRIALVADYRWVPGDSSYTCTDVGSHIEGPWYECDEGHSNRSLKSKLASAGLVVVF